MSTGIHGDLFRDLHVVSYEFMCLEKHTFLFFSNRILHLASHLILDNHFSLPAFFWRMRRHISTFSLLRNPSCDFICRKLSWIQKKSLLFSHWFQFDKHFVQIIGKVMASSSITYLSTKNAIVKVRQSCNVFFKQTILPKSKQTNSVFLPKARSLCKQCSVCTIFILWKKILLTKPFKLARANIHCHFMKTKSLCRTVFSMNGF